MMPNMMGGMASYMFFWLMLAALVCLLLSCLLWPSPRVLVNILLLVINLVLVPEFIWFYFPLIGWGIGLTMHFLFGVQFVRRETQDWQARVEYRAREIHAQRASAA